MCADRSSFWVSSSILGYCSEPLNFAARICRLFRAFPILVSGKVPAGDVAERHDRPERDPGAGIVTPQKAGAVIADGIEAGNGLGVAAQHATDRVGCQPIESAEV